jgi:hypothetical protein
MRPAATWSAAGKVREALLEAGFEVEKKRGFARKREMLCARIDKRRVRAKSAFAPAERRALVIGAGIAGAAVCRAALCARLVGNAARAPGRSRQRTTCRRAFSILCSRPTTACSRG